MKTWNQITSGVLRHVVTAVGGFLVHGGVVANDKVGLYSGAIVAGIGVAQSFLSKLKGDVLEIQGATARFLEPREIQAVPGVGTATPPMGPKGAASLITVSLIAAALFTGCASPVPTTKFSGTIAGQPFEFNGRKQTSVKNLELILTAGAGATATNFSLKIGELSSKNDPQVISKSYAGQAAVTKEFFDGMNSFAGKLVEGAGKGVNPLP